MAHLSVYSVPSRHLMRHSPWRDFMDSAPCRGRSSAALVLSWRASQVDSRKKAGRPVHEPHPFSLPGHLHLVPIALAADVKVDVRDATFWSQRRVGVGHTYNAQPARTGRVEL